MVVLTGIWRFLERLPLRNVQVEPRFRFPIAIFGAIARAAAARNTKKEISSSSNNMQCMALKLNTLMEKIMTTPSGHTSAILASKVKGTAVYNDSGDKIGTVEDVVLDKQSNQILFAALGFGGVLGIGEKYYPVPWSLLDYDEDKGGYVVPLSKDRLENAPAYALKDLTKHDGSLGSIRETTYDYYNVSRDWQ
jgi:sporulation protein YlmC with PRC-barrel domain